MIQWLGLLLLTTFRLFDSEGEGFIRVLTFRVRVELQNWDKSNDTFQGILKEIDEEFSDEELDGIIGEVKLCGFDWIDEKESF